MRTHTKAITTIVVGIVILSVGFLSGWFYATFSDGLFPPHFASDAEVRTLIRDSGISIPENTSELAFLSYGFQDPITWITIKVAPSEHPKLLQQWLSTINGKEKRIERPKFSRYSPDSFPELRQEKYLNLHQFDLSAPSIVGILKRDDSTHSEVAFFSDSESGRVILVSIAGI